MPGFGVDTKAKAVTDVVELCLNMVLRYQFNGFAAQETCAIELAAIQHHLAEPIVILSSRAKAATAGKVGSGTAIRIVCRVNECPFFDGSLFRKGLKPLFGVVGVGCRQPGHFL